MESLAINRKLKSLEGNPKTWLEEAQSCLQKIVECLATDQSQTEVTEEKRLDAINGQSSLLERSGEARFQQSDLRHTSQMVR